LVYVHYNLRLLSHYCEVVKNDRTYMTWDNNPEEANLEDGAIALECLEAELLADGTHDGDHAVEMPPPSTTIVGTSRFPDVAALASQPPALHGGHVAHGHVPQPLPPTPSPIVPRSQGK
jgi:hypothetical protein